MRQSMPRFDSENFKHNLSLVAELENIASRNQCSAAQLALKWVLEKDDNFVPIPGTKHLDYVEENAAAADLDIDPQDLQLADEIFTSQKVHGERYASSHMISLDPED